MNVWVSAITSLIGVVILVALAFGGAMVHLGVLFGVVLPYLAGVVFIVWA